MSCPRGANVARAVLLGLLILAEAPSSAPAAPIAPGSKLHLLSSGSQEFPHLMPGKAIRTMKVYNTKTRAIEVVGTDKALPGVGQWARLAREDRALERRRYGSLLGPLRSRFEALREEERVRVMVSLRMPDGVKHPSKLRHSKEQLERHSRELSRVQPVADLEAVAGRHGLGAPVRIGRADGILELPKYKLRELMFDKDVAAIEEYAPEDPLMNVAIAPMPHGGEDLPDVSTLARSAWHHRDAPVPAEAGAGVNAATFELGLDEGFLQDIGVKPQFWRPIDRFDPRNWVHGHSLMTFQMLTLAAPGGSFFHRESTSYLGEAPWMLEHGIQTTSLSYARRYVTGPLNAEFRQMDDYAYRAPFTLFVTATGNDGWTMEAQWLSYNALNVGNVQHHRQSSFAINNCPLGPPTVSPGCTRTRNPRAAYGGGCLRKPDRSYGYCSSDRELPHLVAPGFTPDSDPNSCQNRPMKNKCKGSLETACGTSLSAPVANGIAAAVIAADKRMVDWPEKVRAAMLVTAENVDAGEWSYAFDGRDGAGVVNGASAVAFAREHASREPGQGPAQVGMGVGQISPADWDAPLLYGIQVPDTLPAGKILRVVLTWTSNPSLTHPINELSDLDLSVTAPGRAKTSGSYNSNVEIVNFRHYELKPGAVLEARVNKTVNRIPAEASADYFYYCVAWAWVDSHAP